MNQGNWRQRRIKLGATVVCVWLLATAALLATAPGGAAPLDTVADRVFGQSGSFTGHGTNVGGVGAGSLNYPTGLAVDGAGNVYAVDQGNQRVLEYDTPLTTDLVADRVFGQDNSFTSSDPNHGGISAKSLSGVSGVAVDSDGNLYIVDDDNNRVLEYDSPLTSDTVADRVFGQFDSFTSGVPNNGGVSRASLNEPIAAVVDATGNLYVSDAFNNRVLEYDSPITTDTLADRVFGQGGSFASGDANHGGVGAGSLSYPNSIAQDRSGRLYVTDTNNNRVLVYDAPLTSDPLADWVFGQAGSFTSTDGDNGGQDAGTLFEPLAVALDGVGNVYIADGSNNRMLEYDSPLTTDVVADRVFGQHGNFSSDGANAGGIGAGSLNYPTGVAVDDSGNLYVADGANNRILEYDNPTGIMPPTPTPAGTPTPPPSGTPAQKLTQGDVDCDHDVDSVDALKQLRHVAALSVSQNEPCPDIGSTVASLFGDVDCDNDVDSVDALKVLRHVAGLPVSQSEPCADIGTPKGG